MSDCSYSLTDNHDNTEAFKVLHSHQRQVMNIQLMPAAKIAKAHNAAGELVGLCGVECHTSRMPEIFSFFVLPQYRHLNIGNACMFLSYQYAQRLGFKQAFLRASSADPESHAIYQQQSYSNPLRDDTDIRLDLCQQCNFYGNRCLQQSYFEIELKAAIAHMVTHFEPDFIAELEAIIEYAISATNGD